MIEKLVVFAHGRDSGPWGTKITALAEVARAAGWSVMSPDYTRSTDPAVRVAQLLELAPRPSGPLVLAGSSMGGYVSAAACNALQASGLFLMAPALYFAGYALPEPIDPPRCTVVHGWRDTVIPVEVGIRFAREHRAELVVVDDTHTLAASLAVLRPVFHRFLETITRPAQDTDQADS